ncbi:MAG: AI-2E family transporter [Roseburia sp.]|nr:AI-2E family transporter [Roseburia sp.]MCM1098136.1 AI-2E family transporter [Ruminococcus flavefaciens]
MVEKLRENRLVILLLLTGAVYFFLKYLVPVTAPILAALLFVTISGPLLQKLQKKWKLHRQVGAVLLLLTACAIVALIAWVLFSWIVGSLPGWLTGLDSLEKEMFRIIHQICDVVGRTIKIDSEYLESTIFSGISDGLDWFRMQFVPGMLSQSLEFVKALAAFGGFLISFLIATVLLAKDYDRIMNLLLDREDCHMLLEIICGITRYIATFVKAQIIIMSVIGSLAAAVLGLGGIKQGVLWGLLAGVLDALPFIGTGIVLLPLGIQQLFLGRYGRAVCCLLLYLACIFIRELLEPRLIGKRVGVSPIAILLAIYAGIKLFGLWGIIEGPLGFIMIYQSYLSVERRRSMKVNNT